ncbi:MAG: antitoxin [Thermodesulfobacteriota bacterium]
MDKEAQEILDSFERGEWEPVEDLKGEVTRHQRYARNTLRKDKEVSIPISAKDLDKIQEIALEKGIPYQTLISSIISRYLETLAEPSSRPANQLDET